MEGEPIGSRAREGGAQDRPSAASVGPPYSAAVGGIAVRTSAAPWVVQPSSAPAGEAPRRRTRPAGGGLPQVVRSWPGRYDLRSSPPDATGAVGPSSYVQLINRGFAIYNRNGYRVFSGGLAGLFGARNTQVGEPQIHWDPYTNAFYYAGIDFAEGRERIFFGWSRTPKPLSGDESQWCKYRYGAYGLVHRIPDFPRLGDTEDFAIVGVNVINDHSLAFMRADLVAFDKPAPGATASCPGSIAATRFMNLSVEANGTVTPRPGGYPPSRRFRSPRRMLPRPGMWWRPI